VECLDPLVLKEHAYRCIYHANPRRCFCRYCTFQETARDPSDLLNPFGCPNGTRNTSRIDIEASAEEKKACRHVWEPNGPRAFSHDPPEDAWKCNRCEEKRSKPVPGDCRVEPVPDVTDAKRKRRR
jgi:hypothetical protein